MTSLDSMRWLWLGGGDAALGWVADVQSSLVSLGSAAALCGCGLGWPPFGSAACALVAAASAVALLL